MQKPLAMFAGSLVFGLVIVFGCSAPNPDGSNLAGGKRSSSSGSSGDDAAPSPSTTSSSGTPGDCSGQPKTDDRPACDTCVKAKCCNDVIACNNSSDCKAMQKCLEACGGGDLACGLTCQIAHDKGAGLLGEVGSCATDQCGAECPAAAIDGGDDPFGDI